MDHVLKRTYISRNTTIQFLKGLFQTKDLVGNDPCDFWRSVKFLNLQDQGASQKEMLALFSKILFKNCDYEVTDCGSTPAAYVYLDDAVFTGNRVLRDITAWIADSAPVRANLHIITLALHRGGYHYATNKIKQTARQAGKIINIKFWRSAELEDRKSYTANSDVLRPIEIPDDRAALQYVKNMKFAPNLRIPGKVGEYGVFSSDTGRQLLEREFLKAGAHIREICPNLNKYQRPLGNMVLDTLGFGSLIVTFRNCPNNAPLALWAGDPWYPLFPRSTNSNTAMINLMNALAKDVF